VAERLAKTSPEKSTRSKKSVVDEEPEEIEVDEVTPPKKKGLLGALTKGFKRKQDDRSPEEAAASSSRSKVRVLMPRLPRPYAKYVQFNVLPIRPSFSLSSNEMAPPPPRSLSPSLASFDSQPGRNYKVERYKFLLSASNTLQSPTLSNSNSKESFGNIGILGFQMFPWNSKCFLCFQMFPLP
jgi:hypothetical protein